MKRINMVKKLFCLALLVCTTVLICMEEPKCELEMPQEIIIEIVMNMLPDKSSITAVSDLMKPLQGITRSLGLGHFKSDGALRQNLVNKIKSRRYNLTTLSQAIGLAADCNELYIAQTLVQAGAPLPCDMIYESIRLGSHWGIQKLLALIKTLPEGAVDFNNMPYFNKDHNVHITNPFEYAVGLLYQAVSKNDNSSKIELKKNIEFLLAWAFKNNYLYNMIAINNNQLIRSPSAQWELWMTHPAVRTFILEEISNYGTVLATKLDQLMPVRKFSFMPVRKFSFW